MGRASREKGNRRELQIVAMHLAAGIHAKKVSRMYGPDEDVLVYIPDNHGPEPTRKLVCEVKGRKSAKGFWQKVKDALGNKDALFLIEDRQEPLVVLPMKVWLRASGGVDG